MTNDTSVISLFQQLNKKANTVFRFATLYSDYISRKQDYGTSLMINMVEVHTLTAIEENPGITVSKLAALSNRSNSAISQTATKLEKRGLITRQKTELNSKNVLLYVTEEGEKLSFAHKQHDILEVTSTLQEISKTCSYAEIEGFFKVIECYIDLLSEDD